MGLRMEKREIKIQMEAKRRRKQEKRIKWGWIMGEENGKGEMGNGKWEMGKENGKKEWERRIWERRVGKEKGNGEWERRMRHENMGKENGKGGIDKC